MPRGRPPRGSKPWEKASAARLKRLALKSAKRAVPTPEVETSEDASPSKHSRKSPLFEIRSRIVPDHATAATTEVTASQIFFRDKIIKEQLSNIQQLCNEDSIISQPEVQQEATESFEPQQHEDENRVTFSPLPSEPEVFNVRPDPITEGRAIFSIFSVVSAIQQVFQHGKECTKANSNLTPSSIAWSAKLISSFVCSCGWHISVSPDSKTDSYPIDEAISLASSAVPIGYQDIRSLFTILELTPPTKTSFGSRCRRKIGFQMDTALQKSLKEAGDEERRLAVEAGDFVSIKNGDEEMKCPAIKVVCDGSWSKRSYGHSYNSKSGNAAIIGVRTKKVLFVGERVTTCRMCQINSKTNKESPHTCFKNWAGPSTAMEAGIIHEGFSKSIQQHGLVYAYFVADGDSTTYCRIKDVYVGITVQKIECINHVLRNLNTKLRNIASNAVKRRYISKEERSLPRAKSRFKRIGLAVQSACRYYKDLGNWECNWKDLREDIRNVPYHIFGRHTNCKSYFQCSKKGQEEDLVDQLKSKPLFLEVVDAIDRVASLARSLIRMENSNIVECYFSVCAKYLEGKRKNLGSGKPRIISFPFLKAGRGDDHYGTNPDRPDLNEETLQVEMDSIRDSVKVTKERQEEIQIATQDQSNSDLWKRERRIRMIASNAKRISSMQDSTDNYAFFVSCSHKPNFQHPPPYMDMHMRLTPLQNMKT
ncbi:hypothetical protein Ocin01_16827 [Orchesella cincta]|uniref:Mutator-like transposase domain-containing protein n=1 Tax=Orchesella cincta TaxID=48709 RepID=A0A1D2MA45_ORCCI|nr:hypothetical protein Ocin01_16827 [Orchesella cincta]